MNQFRLFYGLFFSDSVNIYSVVRLVQNVIRCIIITVKIQLGTEKTRKHFEHF